MKKYALHVIIILVFVSNIFGHGGELIIEVINNGEGDPLSIQLVAISDVYDRDYERTEFLRPTNEGGTGDFIVRYNNMIGTQADHQQFGYGKYNIMTSVTSTAILTLDVRDC